MRRGVLQRLVLPLVLLVVATGCPETGTVFETIPPNGIRIAAADDHDTPVAGVHYVLRYGSVVVFEAKPAHAEAFTHFGPPGTYLLSFTAPAGYTAASGQQTPMPIAVRKDVVTDVVIRLVRISRGD